LCQSICNTENVKGINFRKFQSEAVRNIRML
jgi:hypothetical protein